MNRTVIFAIDRYDRHVPLFLGAVAPPEGIDFKMLEVGMVPPRRDGIDRHRRMLSEREFDVCEVSLASYIMARQRGANLTAVPVFPRRLFSQNHIFVNVDSRIRSPADLVGKRVGLWAFQVTMSVLAKGDLKSEYGVPWEKIHWVTQHPEEIPWSAEGVSVELLGPGKDLSEMLVNGEIDAFIHPHPPPLVQARPDRIRRLFDDTPAECARYYKKRGYYPIMHVLAVKNELVSELPAFPRMVMDTWDESKRQCYDFYHDPGYATLAFARNEYEHQCSSLGVDLWPSGLAANRVNLEWFVDQMVDQRLLSVRPTLEELFDRTVLES